MGVEIMRWGGCYKAQLKRSKNEKFAEIACMVRQNPAHSGIYMIG